MSHTFKQALDAVEPRIPSFFRKGQLVCVYDDADWSIFISYGRIEETIWDGNLNIWLYTVRTTPHDTLITMPSFHIRGVWPAEARKNLVLIRNPLDRR